jgi:imidazole glycerol phosphate synthase subunit HisF
MSVTRRICAVLEHDADGRLLRRFSRGLDVPHVETALRVLANEGADEVWLHLKQTEPRGVAGLYDQLRVLSGQLLLPLVAWGGVKSGPDARLLNGMGADRIVVDVGAPEVDDPMQLIQSVSNAVGPDATVAAVDVRRVASGGAFQWEQCLQDGVGTGRDAAELIVALANAGAGEVVVVPRYEKGIAAHASDLIERVVGEVCCQIVSVGEEREPADLATPLLLGADGVAVSGTFHDGTVTPADLKRILTEFGVAVRPPEQPYLVAR